MAQSRFHIEDRVKIKKTRRSRNRMFERVGFIIELRDNKAKVYFQSVSCAYWFYLENLEFVARYLPPVCAPEIENDCNSVVCESYAWRTTLALGSVGLILVNLSTVKSFWGVIGTLGVILIAGYIAFRAGQESIE